MFQINLNYCAQCKQIDTERVTNCRWLNFNFCHLNCLQQFIDRIECDICKKRFHNNSNERQQLNYNRIHLRDDVKNRFTFVCDECFVQRKPFAIVCYFCANKCYKGFGTWDLKTTGLISKYVCSEECKILALTTTGRKTELGSCSKCHIQERACVRIIRNAKIQSIHCPKCLEKVENEQAIKFETCCHCLSKYTNDCQNVFIIREGGGKKEFCTESCMQSHLREDSATVICCICRHQMRFYDCIRRSCDDRRFCSLFCATLAETNIELLKRNDERCHLENLNLKCATVNSVEFDDSIEDSVLFDELTAATMVASTTSDQVSDRKRNAATMNERSDNEMVILNHFKTYDDIDGLITAPKLLKSAPVVQCNNCKLSIKQSQSSMQWAYLEFCNSICYERFMYNDRFQCASCTKDCGPCNGPNAHIIGNRMYYFCCVECERTFFELMKFCRFCMTVITTMNNSDGFCQSTCRTRFKQLYEKDHQSIREDCAESTEKLCCQCLLMKPVDVFLRANGVTYEFCSFSCYFHQKTSCGLFPDQCAICQMYFILNPTEDPPYLLRHNHQFQTFCSQSCQSHYIYKYQFLDTCSICCRTKSNFNMLKSNVDDIQLKYCSMQCLQIVIQSTELRKAYLNSGQTPNETSAPYFYY